MKTIRMEEMNAPDVRAAMAAGFATQVIAVGSTEQHGPHLPTMTDARIGDATAHRVALKLGNALQARTIPVGCSEHHLAFGATVSLKPETLKLIVRDYVDSQGMPALTANGVLGDPRKASAEKGEVYLEKLASFLIEQVG